MAFVRILRTGRRVLPAIGLLLATTTGAEPPDRVPSFRDRADVPLVLIPLSVRDRRGRMVANLDRDRFRLFIDDIEFPIQSFWWEGTLPVSYVFVLDVSGSMFGRRLARAREAILGFVSQFGPEDEAALITFGAGEVVRRLPFGADPGLLPAILEPLTGYGTTALYDVVAATPQVMDGARNMRRAAFLFTDGVDTASELEPEEAMEVLRSLEDPLFVFGLEPPPVDDEEDELGYEELLREFAVASGGRYLEVRNAAELPRLANQLRRELTMRYIIAFQPSGVGSNEWRRIRVEVSGNYQVTNRQGYRGTLP